MTVTARLAILGGAPAFEQLLHVGRPNIGDRSRLMTRLNGVLDRRWLTNYGDCVQEFERRVAEHSGVKHCIAVCNATTGLEVLIRALDLTGEVIVPSFTFVATAHALSWLNIRPVFADIDPATHCLDPAAVESVITSKTSGIIGVHLWGRSAATAELQAVADRYGLELIFDAAHAFASQCAGRPIGGFGRAEVFSFHATKFVNSLEGGSIVTNDDEIARRCRLMINFGFTGLDSVEMIGTNGKMNEFSAAMGLTSLDMVDELLAWNRDNYSAYRMELSSIKGVRLLECPQPDEVNCQYVVAEVDADAGPLSRDELIEVLHAENIFARRYFYPGVHRMAPYRTMYPNLDLPFTAAVCRQVLVLPTGQTIDRDTISRICDVIRCATENASEVRKVLRERLDSTSVI